MKITWNDKTNTNDPAPKMNGLEYYINRSRVSGIKEAYNDAVLEYVEKYNGLNEKIIKLNKEINFLKSELEVWKKNQHGRKSSLDSQKKKFIDEQKLKGLSNRSIAKALNLSEGTIRNYLKSKNKILKEVYRMEKEKNYCDCGSELVFEEQLSVLDEYDDKLLVCNKYYCPKCYDEYEINEEINK